MLHDSCRCTRKYAIRCIVGWIRGAATTSCQEAWTGAIMACIDWAERCADCNNQTLEQHSSLVSLSRCQPAHMMNYRSSAAELGSGDRSEATSCSLQLPPSAKGALRLGEHPATCSLRLQDLAPCSMTEIRPHAPPAINSRTDGPSNCLAGRGRRQSLRSSWPQGLRCSCRLHCC